MYNIICIYLSQWSCLTFSKLTWQWRPYLPVGRTTTKSVYNSLQNAKYTFLRLCYLTVKSNINIHKSCSQGHSIHTLENFINQEQTTITTYHNSPQATPMGWTPTFHHHSILTHFVLWNDDNMDIPIHWKYLCTILWSASWLILQLSHWVLPYEDPTWGTGNQRLIFWGWERYGKVNGLRIRLGKKILRNKRSSETQTKHQLQEWNISWTSPKSDPQIDHPATTGAKNTSAQNIALWSRWHFDANWHQSSFPLSAPSRRHMVWRDFLQKIRRRPPFRWPLRFEDELARSKEHLRIGHCFSAL